MKQIKQIILASILAIMLLGCGAQKDQIFQASTIVELMRGNYDGIITLKKLKHFGNFGIGTLNALDGELILVAGKAYQAKAGGRLNPAKNYFKSPFAMVTKFKPQQTLILPGRMDLKQLTQYLDGKIDTQNILTAIKIDGLFSSIKFRIVPMQQPPYKNLAEVLKDQQEFQSQNLEGSLIGFYIPRYMAGINTPGYHFHFVSKDKKIGGHVLDIFIQEGQVALSAKSKFYLSLIDKKISIRNIPDNFSTTNNNLDKSNEIKNEKANVYENRPTVSQQENLTQPQEIKPIVKEEPIKAIDENVQKTEQETTSGNSEI